ncbi:MAG TPA: hypothetical protein ENF55_01100 [Thermoprotei archaeon]|nr:hypothetical protein [Thermoprotei archaeon]
MVERREIYFPGSVKTARIRERINPKTGELEYILEIPEVERRLALEELKKSFRSFCRAIGGEFGTADENSMLCRVGGAEIEILYSSGILSPHIEVKVKHPGSITSLARLDNEFEVDYRVGYPLYGLVSEGAKTIERHRLVVKSPEGEQIELAAEKHERDAKPYAIILETEKASRTKQVTWI